MRTVFLLLFVLCSKSSIAQESIALKMARLARIKPYSTLFVHFDKNIYSNNETIYFTGYLVKSAISPIAKHQILSVNLIREIDTTVVLSEKFTIESGLSMGSIVIPDSIQSGNYRLVAHTDQLINGFPEMTFVQKITLKTNFDPPFKANLKILDPKNGQKLTHQVLFSATTNDNRFLPKPIAIHYRYGSIKNKAKTDPSGQVLLSLPAQNNLVDPNLYVKLAGEKDTSYISLALPSEKNRASVSFFPEGGSCTAGLANYVAWEVKDQQRRPMAVKGFLYENGKVLDTIETTSYGIGRFTLFYKRDASYTVKLIHDGVVDTLYELPKAKTDVPVINVAKAVCTDSLAFTVRNVHEKRLTIRLHNFREVFVEASYNTGPGLHRFKIALTDVPKGLATLTITDSLDRPLVERMVFAHYKKNETLTLATNKSQYHQREPVTLKLGLTGADSLALVSIAVVQENRIDRLKATDIESYAYIQNELEQFVALSNRSILNDPDGLEQLLMVKGWRRYTWQDLDKTKEQDSTSLKQSSLKMLGSVLRKNKKLITPITLSVWGDSRFHLVTTASDGAFNFNSPDLLTEPGKKTYLMVNDPIRANFTIKIDDQFSALSQRIKSIGAEEIVPPSKLANNYELIIKGNEKAIRLNEVVIKSSKDKSFNWTNRGANTCGDYVCKYNIFNCRNHIGDAENRPPQPGRSYSGLIGPYIGCQTADAADEHIKFKGIHFAKEFYYSDYKDPLEPAFFSTIYWNYGVLLSKNRPSEIKFYTSDILGKFKIVIQGMSGTELVYAERTFEVTAK